MNVLITLTANKAFKVNYALKKLVISLASADEFNKIRKVGIVDEGIMRRDLQELESLGIYVRALGQRNILRKLFKAREILVKEKINIVHCAGFKQLVFYHLASIGVNQSISIVMTERDTARWETWSKRFASKLILFVTRPHLHVLNQRHFDYMHDHSRLHKKMALIPNAARIEMGEVDGGSVVRENYLNTCYVKSIRSDTGHDDVLKLGSLIKKSGLKIIIHVIGGGALYSDFLANVSTYKLEDVIVCYGHLEHEVAMSMLNDMDVGITTSPTEMMPNFILECFCLGIPVVGYMTQGVEDLVIGGVNGELSQVGDVEGMFHHLSALATNANILGELSLAALSASEKYTPEIIGVKIIKFYNEIKGVSC